MYGEVKMTCMYYLGFTTEYAEGEIYLPSHKVAAQSPHGTCPSLAQAPAPTADRLRVHGGNHTNIRKQHNKRWQNLKIIAQMDCSRKKQQNDVLNAKNGVWEQKILNKQNTTFYLTQINEPGAFCKFAGTKI